MANSSFACWHFLDFFFFFCIYFDPWLFESVDVEPMDVEGWIYWKRPSWEPWRKRFPWPRPGRLSCGEHGGWGLLSRGVSVVHFLAGLLMVVLWTSLWLSLFLPQLFLHPLTVWRLFTVFNWTEIIWNQFSKFWYNQTWGVFTFPCYWNPVAIYWTSIALQTLQM